MRDWVYVVDDWWCRQTKNSIFVCVPFKKPMRYTLKRKTHKETYCAVLAILATIDLLRHILNVVVVWEKAKKASRDWFTSVRHWPSNSRAPGGPVCLARRALSKQIGTKLFYYSKCIHSFYRLVCFSLVSVAAANYNWGIRDSRILDLQKYPPNQSISF